MVISLLSNVLYICLKNIKDPIEITEYLNKYYPQKDTWQKYPAHILCHKTTIMCTLYAFRLSDIYKEGQTTQINEENCYTQDKIVSYDILEQIKN